MLSQVNHNIANFQFRFTKGKEEQYAALVDSLVNTEPHITEKELRKRLEAWMSARKCGDEMILNGNSIWYSWKVMRDFRKLWKNYDVNNFTDYLYRFFSLRCGSIAHYNKFGWFDAYDTQSKLRDFLNHNEMGQNVLSYQLKLGCR